MGLNFDSSERKSFLGLINFGFQELININHGLLRVLGVSHTSLERMCEVAAKHGLSAKLTGAGGGGYGFVFIQSQTVAEITEDLKEVGVKFFNY